MMRPQPCHRVPCIERAPFIGLAQARFLVPASEKACACRPFASGPNLLSVEDEAVPGRNEGEGVFVGAEGERCIDAVGSFGAAEQQRVRAVLVRDEDLQPPFGDIRAHAEQVEEVGLSGAVRPDENRQVAELEILKRPDGLEAANGDTVDADHGRAPGVASAATLTMASSFSPISGSISDSGTYSASLWKFVFIIRFGMSSF